MPGTHGDFEAAYQWGVLDEDLEPARTLGVQRQVSVEGFALGGCVLTPEGALEHAYVVIGADRDIAAVQTTRPEAVAVIDTGGVVLPGLIDLHGHPEFNVFAPWEPPQLFANRYEWRQSDIYRQLVREPQDRLLAQLAPRTQARYAEILALVGGVTAIQGASGRYPDKAEALVRNIDLRIFGAHRARSMIDLPTDGSSSIDQLARILRAIAAGEVDAFYLHLAEGRRDDERSAAEFGRLVELGALTRATILIHGSALGRQEFAHMADAGAALVWSPQSNLRLYGQTTDAAEALAAGVRVGLGADWLPSGSPSLLAEIKVARRVLARQGRPTTARELVTMVTSGAAGIAGLGEHLGSLVPGRPADVLVLERHHEDPWESVVAADPSWVELVTIDADVSYGRADWVGPIVGPERASAFEPVLAWGKQMLLDTSYAALLPDTPAPSLAQLRADLISQYPQVGPIFA